VFGAAISLSALLMASSAAFAVIKLQGVLTCTLNPKVALFFLAFLPQFVAADSPHKALAFLTLGLIFISSGTLWCFTVAAFAAKATGRIRQSPGAIAWVNRLLGGMFVYLGIRVAMMSTR
jgi:threonine/homoserine/homoserine lactone efflux protein